MENFKKIFELSHSDIRSQLYSHLDASLDTEEYSWISDVYDSYFVANIYSYAQNNEYDKYFKFDYTKDDEKNVVAVDLESKKEVTLQRDWIETTEVQKIQNSLKEKTDSVEELTKQLSESNSKIDTISLEKEKAESQFNEASEKIVQLSSQVDELKPFKSQFEEEQTSKALAEKKDFYAAKFEALKASEKFESEDVQNLISKSIEDSDEGKQAVLQLNSMLVDMVVVNNEQDQQDVPAIRELSSRRENLIPTDNDFESRYSL